MDVCHRFLTTLSTNELFWIEKLRDFLLQDIDYTVNLKTEPTAFAHAATFDFNHHGRKFSIGMPRYFHLYPVIYN